MSNKLKVVITGAAFFILFILGATYWFFMLRGSSRVIAECIPSQTLAYMTFPDLTKSAIRYQSSDLKKFMESKEVALLGGLVLKEFKDAFLKTGNEEQLKIAEKLWQSLKGSVSGETFLAITKIEAEKSDVRNVGIIMGTHPSQGTMNFSSFVKEVNDLVLSKADGLNQGDSSHLGVSYHWVGKGEDVKVCSAVFDGWGIVALGEDTIKAFIESYKNPAGKAQSLAANPKYQKIKNYYQEGQDCFAYLNMDGLSNFLIATLENDVKRISALNDATASGAGTPVGIPQIDPAKNLQMIKKYFTIYDGAAFGARFNGSKLQERWIVNFSDNDLAKQTIAIYKQSKYVTARYTGKETQCYGAYALDMRKYVDYLLGVYREMGLQVDEGKEKVSQSLQTVGLDLDKNIIDALGDEVSFQIDWSEQEKVPNVALYIEIKNPEDFKPTREFLEKVIPQMAAGMGGLTITEKTVGNSKMLSTSSPFVQAVSPTLVLEDKFVSIQLTQSGAERSIQRDGKESVLLRPEIQKYLGDKPETYVQIVYCNTPLLLDRAYAAAKNFAKNNPMGASMIPIPVGQWPQELTFTKAMGEVCWKSKVENTAIIFDAESGVGSQILPLSMAAVAGIAAMPKQPKPPVSQPTQPQPE